MKRFVSLMAVLTILMAVGCGGRDNERTTGTQTDDSQKVENPVSVVSSKPTNGTRKWTFSTGQTIEAEFLAAKDGKVRLMSIVPIDSLSNEDQAWVKQHSDMQADKDRPVDRVSLKPLSESSNGGGSASAEMAPVDPAKVEAKINKRGGWVTFADKDPNKPIVEIHFGKAEVTDADLASIRGDHSCRSVR